MKYHARRSEQEIIDEKELQSILEQEKSVEEKKKLTSKRRELCSTFLDQQ